MVGMGSVRMVWSLWKVPWRCEVLLVEFRGFVCSDFQDTSNYRTVLEHLFMIRNFYTGSHTH